MNKHIVRSGVAALALSGVMISAAAVPAKADTTTTQNIIYGAAAAAAAFTLYNVQHKHQLASTVQGYLPDGSTVYQDGHVVSRNGRTWYPGNYGESVACSNQYCTINGGNGNYNYGYNSGDYTYGYNDAGSSYGYNNRNYNDRDRNGNAREYNRRSHGQRSNRSDHARGPR